MNPPTTIAETVRAAAQTLSAFSDSPRLDAELLLAKVLGVSRPALIARDHETVLLDNGRAFAELIGRRAAGTPVAYLIGSREFWSLQLAVSPAVLVPRPETETLIERALALKPADLPCEILDLGTGSGAIALAIGSERPRWRITGVDLSSPALEVAMQNAASLNLANVKWCLGSWFAAIGVQRFDLIVANPPYVASSDPALARLSAEPQMALTAGPTGLEALAAIIEQAALHLHAHGWLVLEHGISQGLEVTQSLARHGFTSIRTYPDFSGRPRVTLGTVYTQH